MSKRWITIDVCANHPETRAIAIDDEYGGTRLVGPKCCGRWTRLDKWEVSADDLREIENAIGYEIEEMEDES